MNRATSILVKTSRGIRLACSAFARLPLALLTAIGGMIVFCSWAAAPSDPTACNVDRLVQEIIDGNAAGVREVLSARRANVNSLGHWGVTPLGHAVAEARRDGTVLVRMLLASGADANVADSTGATPLAYAIALGHDECGALLLRAGADPIVAASRSDPDMIRAADESIGDPRHARSN